MTKKMTKIKLTLITVLFVVLYSSCTAQSEVGVTRLECFQALLSGKYVSLGLYEFVGCYDSEPILLISFSNYCTGREPIAQYDGFVYYGAIKDVGTYEYTTTGNEKMGIKPRRKIVRAVMPLEEYKEMCKCDRDHLYKKLDIVLERE